MTNRERFHKLMHADSTIDRYPALEWAVWWDKTIDFWEKEGIPKNMTNTELFDYFGLDRNVQFWFPHKSPDCPKEKFHGNGIIKNEEDYERIKPFIYPEDAAWPDLLMIGGFDKMCMLKGKEDIKAEFERLVSIIRYGKYLPAMDHQTPPGTTADNYRYYVKLLKEYGSQACRYSK